jgi:hypothetical protein
MKMTKNVFVVIYETLDKGIVTSTAVSQIAYGDYPRAVRFVDTRHNIWNFKSTHEGVWETDTERYTIKELTVQ